ncbi:putative reverse transcriptase domain [Abeliophyllum distichum]|uniref:Reverse transcriptase domain n=1 Tax=Abeliophyllum distichum TaxID=126358 RepID=A0ABD1U1Z7_9LAMI
MIEIKIFPSKYDMPIIVAGLFDTGAACSILNPTVLPSSMWKPHRQIFQAANNEYFSTEIISKPVSLQFFPNCKISHRLLGSSLPRKDIVIGFDIIQQLWSKKVIPKNNGLQYKSHFLPYIRPTTYFSMTSIPSLKEKLIQDCCAESHTDFLSKCTNPLWKNSEFFVALPFKLNEDANPTKASHTGMSPEHIQLATTELANLQAEGLIEPTNSQWACQAFYVNKRAVNKRVEQVRGKMRLVIDYKLLNHFLADDKFPLPNRKALFDNLSTAKIFSKFDLKAGFWQIGILPEEMYKTGFCIPNSHFQWTVMPFRLKTTPSLFQKAITRIYHPIMKSALVYIDDILLFSPDESSHSQLLSDFYDITKAHGVMLAQKKMQIGVNEVDFIGMHIKNGQYSLQPHIGQELLKFSDSNLSKKEIQQFLGIVNYMADFIDHLSTVIKPLQNMLKKNAPPWTDEQTKAIQLIKQKVHSLPALSIPNDGKIILQTDASDLFWAAVLLEENNGKRNICGYKNGSFSDAEKHYHSTFKEILAVKRGIEKFQFHLIGHHFFIEMDMSAFPKMLSFKQKQIPNSQLLRWAEWFANFDFEVKHIKGHDNLNLLPDLLSRPKPKISAIKPIPIICMMGPSSSKPSSSNPSSSRPPEIHPNMDNFPPGINNLIKNKTLKARSKELMLKYQSLVIQKHGIHIFGGLGFHPDYPFLNLFFFNPDRLQWAFSKEILCFLWYLLELHKIAFCFNAEAMATWLPELDYDLWKTYHELYPEPNSYAKKFFEWFHPVNHWMEKFHVYMGKFKDIRTSVKNVHVIIVFDRQGYFTETGYYTHFSHTKDYTVLPYNLHKDWEGYPKEFRTFQRKMAEINQTIPPEIWPNIDDDAPWETLPISYAKRLQEDIEIHMKKRYPMYNYYCLPQPDSAHFDTSWSQLYLGRPTQSLGFTSKYGENTPEGQAHRERLWKMLHDNISATSLSTPQEPSTNSQTGTSAQPIIMPHQLDVTQYMIRPYFPRISQVPEPSEPGPVQPDPSNPDNIEIILDQMWEEERKVENLPWWKQQGLPSDSDDSDSPAHAANLGTP